MEPLLWCAALVDADQSSKRDKSKKGIKQQQQPAAPVVDAAAATEDDDASRDPTPPPSGLGAEEQRPKSWIDPHLRETTAEAATDTIPPLDSTDLITRLTSSLNIDPTSAYLVSAAIAEADDDTLPVKSLALFATGSPAIAILPANKKLDPFKLARHLKLTLTSRKAMSKQVRLATPIECVHSFGYRPGTVPPLGHRELYTPIILESECASSPIPLLGGGGDFGTLLRIEPSCLLSQAHVSVADICEGSNDVSTAAAEVTEAAAVEVTDGPPIVSSVPSAGSSALGSTAIMNRAAAASTQQQDGSSDTLFEAPTLRESLIISEPRFLVDAMMGRLLRWLRVLGVDTLLREEGESISDVFARTQREKRILLTRDRKLAERRDVGASAVFVVGSDEPREQLREVVAHFGLRLSADEFMMRCSVCNGRGYYKIDRVEAAQRDDCPPKVLESVEDFYVCRSCGKLYWEGPKSNNAFDHFASVLDGFGAVASLEGKVEPQSRRLTFPD